MLPRLALIASLFAVLCASGGLAFSKTANAQTEPNSEARTQAHRERTEQVRRAESAFARTMADRDHEAFSRYLADDAIFVGSRETYRGRNAIALGWKRFFEGDSAPFSWRPEQVEVLASGGLALSSGPVLDPDGRVIGTFNSIWRLEPDGAWRVVFDKGCAACEDP